MLLVEILFPISECILSFGILIANGWILHILNRKLKSLSFNENLLAVIAIPNDKSVNQSNDIRDSCGVEFSTLCAAEECPSSDRKASAAAEQVEATSASAPAASEFTKAVARQSLVDLRSTQIAHLLICTFSLLPDILIDLLLVSNLLIVSYSITHLYALHVVSWLVQFLSAVHPYVLVALLLTKVPPIRRALPFCTPSLLRCAPLYHIS